MSEQYMWGEKGEYGPFSVDKNGYPNAGEVVRYFRILRGLSALQFAELYGEALGEKPKTRIWVLTMERIDNVPTDIARRRAIVNILGIPYFLLGVSQVPIKTPLLGEATEEVPRISKQETLITETLTEHEQALTAYVDGYFHRHGQAALGEVSKATEQVSTLISSAREQTQQRGIALISRYYQFGTNVAKQKQQYDVAISYADKAIEYAGEVHKIKPNSDLIATAFYRRALPIFEQESTHIGQESDYGLAISDIDIALYHAQSSTLLVNGFISLDWGLLHAYIATSEKEKTEVRKRLIDSYTSVSQHLEDDNRNFFKGSLSWYYLRYAEALIALGDYSEAIGQLELAEEFTPLTFPRRMAYIDLLRAKAYVGLRDFPEALIHANDALKESKTVKSEYNIARIAHVYRQLKEGGYKHSSDLTELGRELTKTHPHLVLI